MVGKTSRDVYVMKIFYKYSYTRKLCGISFLIKKIIIIIDIKD